MPKTAILRVDEGAFGQGKLDPRGIEVSELALDDVLDRRFGSQKDRANETRQEAGRLDDARVGRLGKDHRRLVLHDREDLFVQGPLDIVHWCSLQGSSLQARARIDLNAKSLTYKLVTCRTDCKDTPDEPDQPAATP